MLIPSLVALMEGDDTSLSRGMNANSQLTVKCLADRLKSIKRDEC